MAIDRRSGVPVRLPILLGFLPNTFMMNLLRLPLWITAFCCAALLSAQHLIPQRMAALRNAGTTFGPVSLLSREAPSPENTALWRSACRTADVLRYNGDAARNLIASAPMFITLAVPSSNGAILLDLERADVLADGFTVRRASDGRVVEAPAAVHYRGMVQGDPSSVVAISVFDDHLMGLIADGSGERIIGPFEQGPRGQLVLYHERDLLGDLNFACATREGEARRPDTRPDLSEGERSTRCVRMYWEAAYDIFQNKGSVAATVTYITGLFNQSATLFANDGVQVSLLETFVWDVASPYNATSSGGRLSQFGTERTSFNGDLAHLLDYANYGGVAWLSSLCSSTSSRMAYSGIDASFNNVPTYSWSTMVVTHEAGHNMGSNHTHACVWNGNGTAIDGCGPQAGYTEGSCPQAPLPPGGGTIMSYCHLIGGTGINLSFGFGPQPAAVIVDEVNGSGCLLVCGSTCDAPGLRYVNPLGPVTATLHWANTGAVSYTLRWKAQSSGTWNTVAGLTVTNHSLSGLTQSTAYEFQVMAVCASGQSAYSSSTAFTTPAPCPDTLEPNNTQATAAAITLPTNISALIATASDQDHYGFTLAAASMVYLNLGGLPADYDLYLLNSGGSTVASSANAGTTNEYISFSASAGSYTIRVSGWNGAFDGLQCYSLFANAYASNGCQSPTWVESSNITYDGATLSWAVPGGVSSFDLRWKPSAGQTWTTVTGISTNSYLLTGLAPETSYDVQVRSVCQGSEPGNLSEPHTFTTTTAPCEVAPPILVSVKLFLEGPFNTGTGLMSDALRNSGLLPLSEPYTALGLPVTGPFTSTTNAVFSVTGNNAITDWVLVELRDAATGATVIERKAALVQRDGDVVALNGESPLGFCTTAGTYRVAVRHRNHLGVMTGQGIVLGNTPTGIDLTSAATGTYGTNARKASGSVRLLWAGNSTGDVQVKYTGPSNDRDPILLAVGSTTPNASVSGYLRTDVNMDGVAKYTGSGNDRDPILLNVGNTTPNATRQEQLP